MLKEFPKSKTKTNRTQRIIDKSTICCLSLIDKTSRMRKDIEVSNNTIDKLVLIDIYRTLNLMTAEYIVRCIRLGSTCLR